MTYLIALVIAILVAFFMAHQSLTVRLATLKGYSGIRPMLVGLVPGIGLLYYLRQTTPPELKEGAIEEIMKIRNFLDIMWRNLHYGLVVIAVLSPSIILIAEGVTPGTGTYFFAFLILIQLVFLFTHQALVLALAGLNHHRGPRPFLFGFLPGYGLYHYLKRIDDHQRATSVLNPRYILTSTFVYLQLALLTAFVILPVLYVFSTGANRYFIIPSLLVFLFTHQSLVVSVADRKGYQGIIPGLMGLLPGFGFYYYLKLRESKRNISTDSLAFAFNPRNILGTMVIYTELVLLGIIVLVPIVYVVGASLSPFAGLPSTIWPENPTLDNFRFLLSGVGEYGGQEITTNFTAWYWNTLQIAFFTMVFAVLFITGTAYVFSRYKFRGKKTGLLMILVLQMFPSFLGLIALFTLLQTFGLLDQPLALVVVYTAGAIPFNVWLIKGYLSSIPKELDESARMDGASKLTIFTKIILPLSLPIIGFVAVTQFMAPWMDYILPSFVIRSEERWTLAVGIFAFIDDPTRINYPAFAASALLVAIPITILYVSFQKYLIEGITAGANKG